MANNDATNVKIGVCSVTYKGTDLGFTQGGVEVEVATESHEVLVDQFGTTPLADTITGRTCKVRVPLAETTLENLVALMPGATLITDGVDSTKLRVDVTSGVGTSLIDSAGVLSLHPKVLSASDVSEDFTLPLAATPGAINFAYKTDEERIFNVEFTAYVDTSAGNLLFQFGDLTASE
jgi:hypothetical protein